jgi:hypothetical protein
MKSNMPFIYTPFRGGWIKHFDGEILMWGNESEVLDVEFVPSPPPTNEQIAKGVLRLQPHWLDIYCELGVEQKAIVGRIMLAMQGYKVEGNES